MFSYDTVEVYWWVQSNSSCQAKPGHLPQTTN